MGSLKPEGLREILRLYGDIVGAATKLELEDKGTKSYDETRARVWYALQALYFQHSDIRDSLEENPIHFKPSELEAKVWKK